MTPRPTKGEVAQEWKGVAERELEEVERGSDAGVGNNNIEEQLWFVPPLVSDEGDKDGGVGLFAVNILGTVWWPLEGDRSFDLEVLVVLFDVSWLGDATQLDEDVHGTGDEGAVAKGTVGGEDDVGEEDGEDWQIAFEKWGGKNAEEGLELPSSLNLWDVFSSNAPKSRAV